MAGTPQEFHDERRAREAAAGKVSHVIASTRFARGTSDGPCSCSCGWTGLASGFAAHRAAAGKPSPNVLAGGLHNEHTWEPGRVATEGPAPLDERPHREPTRRAKAPPVRRFEPSLARVPDVPLLVRSSSSDQPPKEESMPAIATEPTHAMDEAWRLCHDLGLSFAQAAATIGGITDGAVRFRVKGYAELTGWTGPLPGTAAWRVAHPVADSGNQATDEPLAATSLLEDLSSTDHVPATPDLGDTDPAFDAIEDAARNAPRAMQRGYPCGSVTYASRATHEVRCPLHPEGATEPADPLVADRPDAMSVAPDEPEFDEHEELNEGVNRAEAVAWDEGHAAGLAVGLAEAQEKVARLTLNEALSVARGAAWEEVRRLNRAVLAAEAAAEWLDERLQALD